MNARAFALRFLAFSCALGALFVQLPARAEDRAKDTPPEHSDHPDHPPDRDHVVEREHADHPPDRNHCDDVAMTRIYARSKASIVRIERPDAGLGTGFMFYSPKHVLTAFHVVDLGRDLYVKFANGKRLRATVVATDTDHDLAILELEKPVFDAPILIPHTDLEIGMRVLAIGNPYGDAGEPGTTLEGLLNYSASQGTVSAVSADMFQTDTLLAPGNSGGPIFACDGGVVGVADLLLDNRIGFAVRISRAMKLAFRLYDPKGPFHGTISFRDATVGLLAESDVSDFLGVAIGGRIVAVDRISIDARLGAMFELPRDTSDPVASRSVVRGVGELALGYRALFFPYSFPVYATLSGGVGAYVDRGSQRNIVITYDDPACPGAATCVPKLGSVSNDIRDAGALPMASLHFTFASFDLGYAFKLDVIHPSLSTQRIYAGLVF